MIITCEQRHRIGYIYLQRPNPKFTIWDDIENKAIEDYLDGVKAEIPMVKKGKELVDRIRGMTICDKTYLEDLDRQLFGEEYLNDKDRNGYIVGIELDLSKEELVRNIKEQIYKIYMIDWKHQNYILLTLSQEDKLFGKENIVYAANKNGDTYYIVSIVDDTAYIRGIITRRLELYPIEYLKQPLFILN